jgi:hypothetical protein
MKKSFDSGSVFDYWLRRYEFYERTKRRHHTRGTNMKYRIDINEGVVALPQIVRLLVVIFCPWLALWVARKQLWIACLVIRNEGMSRFPEHHTLIRWGNEIQRGGRMEPQPDSEPNR